MPPAGPEDIRGETAIALACAGGFTLVLASFNLGGIRRPLPYAAVGVMLWAAMLASGIHATIAGILVAFVIPIRPKFEPALFIERVKETSIKMQKARTAVVKKKIYCDFDTRDKLTSALDARRMNLERAIGTYLEEVSIILLLLSLLSLL